METERAIRTRRTIKSFEADPIDRATLEQLLGLARWAPNHHLTNPWRFRVLGPRSLDRLKEVAAAQAIAEAPEGSDLEAIGRIAAAKLERAPTLIVCSAKRSDDPTQYEEDCAAAACAAYIVLLAAHDAGLAGYWRTPAVLRTPAGRSAIGLPDDEHFVGLINLGQAAKNSEAPERSQPSDYVTFLE